MVRGMLLPRAHMDAENVSRKRKLEQFHREAHQDSCFWKAKRGSDMALGEIERIKKEIHNASSPAYEQPLTALSAVDRDHVLACVSGIKDSLVEFSTHTFSYHEKMPSLVGNIVVRT